MRKQQGGFTLIELVMVIVILGILAASFAPSFVDLSTGATTAARASASGAVKSALTVAIARDRTEPTVTALAALVQGGATPVATGVQVQIRDQNGVNQPVVVPTFTLATCAPASATVAVGDIVRCVGDAP